MSISLQRLVRRLEHEFRQPALLEQALTHRSAGRFNNERLEFLGDAVLGMVIADELYCRFGDIQEGVLSRMRAALVNEAALAELARELDLGECLRLGPGELKSGGFRRDSTLACALEAIIGAVYLDGGFEAAQRLIVGLYRSRLEQVDPANVSKDPKTRLQEHLQALRQPLPVYELVEVSGDAHEQTFRVECRLEGLDVVTRGSGRSRRIAEQEAAAAALAKLKKERSA